MVVAAGVAGETGEQRVVQAASAPDAREGFRATFGGPEGKGAVDERGMLFARRGQGVAFAGKTGVDRGVPEDAIAFGREALLRLGYAGNVQAGFVAEFRVEHVAQVEDLVTQEDFQRGVVVEPLAAQRDDGPAFAGGVGVKFGPLVLPAAGLAIGEADERGREGDEAGRELPEHVLESPVAKPFQMKLLEGVLAFIGIPDAVDALALQVETRDEHRGKPLAPAGRATGDGGFQEVGVVFGLHGSGRLASENAESAKSFQFGNR